MSIILEPQEKDGQLENYSVVVNGVSRCFFNGLTCVFNFLEIKKRVLFEIIKVTSEFSKIEMVAP